MAFVGSLSGSVGTIAVTGSFVPGADNTYSIGTGGAKWTAVVASQLTGSLTKLADGNPYLIAGTNVSLTTGSGGAITIDATSAASTPGGVNTNVQYNADGTFGGSSSFTFASGTDTLSVTNLSSTSVSTTSLTASYVTSSGGILTDAGITAAGDIAVNGGDLTTTSTGTATLFNANATTVNIAGDATTVNIGSTSGGASAIFGSKVVTSGSITVKDGTGLLTITGGTSSRSEIIAAAGNLFLDSTGGDRVIIDTNLELVGTDLYAGGGGVIAKNIFADIVSPSYPITIGGATSKTVVGGNLTVTGNQISGSSGGNITLGATGDIAVAGDVAVNGGDITTTATTATVFNTTATTVNVGGAATTLGIGSSTGTTTVNNTLVIKGDLYVSGTTTTVDSTVVEIQDPVIGLGFASGSVAGVAGDRGFIGGITGAGNNVAFVWSNSNSAFAATKTVTAPGATPVALSVLQPIRAGSFQVNGTNAYVTSSDGLTLELNGASGKGTKFTIGASTAFAELLDNGANAQFGAVAGKNLIISGTNSVTINVGNAGAIIQRDGTQIGTIGGNSTNFNIVAATGVLTSSLLNSNAQLINFGGAATTINVGNSAGNVTFAGDIAVNGGDITTPAATFNLVNANATTVSVAGDATTLNIANGATAAQTLNLGTASTGASTYNLATGATATSNTKTINLGTGGAAGSTTNINIGSAQGGTTTVNKDLTVSGNTLLNGNTTLGDTTGDRITFTGYVTSSILPSDDLAFTLGSQAQRWQHIYTGDLHLRNDRGDYTLIEEEDFLSIRFNKTGKRYKFLLEAVPELDEK